MRFLSTFRGRLLMILAFLLVVTLGVQYYLNYLNEDENNDLREKQEASVTDGLRLGTSGVTSDYRMSDLLAQGQARLSEEDQVRIKDILIIDNELNVTDSLKDTYLPVQNDDGTVTFKYLPDLTDLPPLMQPELLGDDAQNFPNADEDSSASDDEAHVLPVETSKGRWYVMVILHNDPRAAAFRAAKPLVFTLGILLVSTLITFYLVWRFTRPITNLSLAAREVAKGNLAVRVPDSQRTDEMGQLARQFNEMTSELEKKSELEAKLQQAEKSAVVGRLGSAIAHEIRNPLNYINLTLDHLRSKFKPEEADKAASFEKLTSQLKAEVARINQQISDFLNYSRPANADLRPVDPRRVVEDSLRIVEPEAEEKHIKIGFVEQEDVTEIMADPEFLRSVFNNLFINAVQSMEGKGGNLNIKISPDDDFVRFDISDTGSGISEENLSKIFEPYFSTKETGTGLGLAIVHKIIDIHHGTIDVNSQEGNGTSFTIKLPKAEN
ncbi:MAG TPA: ATP-binding protein [Pyrinomonadaceae bacterium]